MANLRSRLALALERPISSPWQHTRTSWSQFAEDLLIQNYLGEGPGTYVDVGAGHATRGSNTYRLYRMGWHGILVEPIERLAKSAARIRRRDQVVSALCGSMPGESTFFEFEPWQLSTVSNHRAKTLIAAGHRLVTERCIQVTTLRNITRNFSAHEPSVLSIDVEGWDYEVLLGNDWSTFRPSLICVEEALRSAEERGPTWQFLRDLGYTRASRSVVSSIYLSDKFVDTGFSAGINKS